MNTIKLYGTSTCPYCAQVREFLKQHNQTFTDIDVSADQQAAQEMIDKSGQMGVPVLEINNEIVAGFDQVRISQLLGIGS